MPNLRRCWLGLLVAGALGATASAQVTVSDDRGTVLTLDAPPRRIVSLLPSLTETVCALGACDRLVGTDRYSNWPASVAALPKLGGLDDAQVESIVALRPDLVLLSTSARVTDRLEALGIKVVVLASKDHADARRSLALVAQLLGRPEAGDKVWGQVERETAAAAARVPAGLRGQRVYFEIDATPYAAGPGSFIGETLALLGLRDALPAEFGPFPKLNPEYVVRLQPDIMMATQQNLVEMPRRPGWSTLHALRAAHTCGFASNQFDLLVRPGPRMGEGAGVIADCLVAIAARDAAPSASR